MVNLTPDERDRLIGLLDALGEAKQALHDYVAQQVQMLDTSAKDYGRLDAELTAAQDAADQYRAELRSKYLGPRS